MKDGEGLKRDTEKARAFMRRGRESGAKSLQRSARAAQKRRQDERRSTPKKPMKRGRRRSRRRSLPAAQGWLRRVTALYGHQCAVCGGRAVQGHHVVPFTVIDHDTRKTAADRDVLVWDARNGLPVCEDCHGNHESGARRIPRSALDAAHIAWAEEHGYSRRVSARLYPTKDPATSATNVVASGDTGGSIAAPQTSRPGASGDADPAESDPPTR